MWLPRGTRRRPALPRSRKAFWRTSGSPRSGSISRAFTPEETARVKATLSDLVTVANPLDYHTFIWGKQESLESTFTAAMGCGFDLSMLVLDFPRDDRCSDASWEPTLRAVVTAAERT